MLVAMHVLRGPAARACGEASEVGAAQVTDQRQRPWEAAFGERLLRRDRAEHRSRQEECGRAGFAARRGELLRVHRIDRSSVKELDEEWAARAGERVAQAR